MTSPPPKSFAERDTVLMPRSSPSLERADLSGRDSAAQPWLRFALWSVLGAGVIVAVTAFLYAISWHSFPGNSDNANAVLAGHAMSHGNVLLRGWRLPGDTYWPLDLGVFAAFTAVAGVGPAAFHAAPTAIFLAVLAVAVVLGSMDAGGRARGVAVTVTLVMLALPAPRFSYIALEGPYHVGSVLFCLVAFALLRPGPRWKWCVAVLILATALLSDPAVYAIGIAPVAAAGVVWAARAHRWRAGAGCWGAVGFAVVGAIGARKVLVHLGQQVSPRPPIVLSHFLRNAAAVPRGLLPLFGIGSGSRVATVAQVAHVVGFAFAILAVAVASWSAVWAVVSAPSRRRRHHDPKAQSLDDLLTLAFFGSLALYIMIATTPSDASNLRYLVPAVVFAAILAGRRAARVRVTLRGRETVLAALCAGGLMAFYVSYVSAAAVPLRDRVPAGPTALVAWLEAHSLTNGMAPYWDASTVTVESRGRLPLRPVIVDGARIRPFYYYAASKWFTPSQPPAQSSFLVYQPNAPWGGVDTGSATATFGRPTSVTDVGVWRILVWNHDVVPQLGPPA